MAKIEFGTSSPEVKSLQKLMNQVLGKGAVPESGTYDETTRDKMAELQGKLDVGHTSGLPDNKTMAAIKEALTPRTKVVVNGVEAWVTKEQLAQLRKVAGKRAAEAVRPFVSMADEAMMYWEAHNSARKDNAFWSGFVDIACNLDFPPKSAMSAAVAAAKALERQAATGTMTPADLKNGTTPIKAAFVMMDDYRTKLFGRGETLITVLEGVRDTCVLTLQVTAAVATGGSSWGVQVGVSAGVAAYDSVLKEVDKASKTSNYNISDGMSQVFMATICDATVGLILKGGGAKDIMDGIAKEATKEVTTSWMKKRIATSLNGGAQQMIKDGINGLPGLMDPKKKWDVKDIIEAAAKSFIKGALLKEMDGVFKKFGEGASKHLKPEMFKGMGLDPSKLDKAGAEGLKKVVDKASGKVLDKVSKSLDPAKTTPDEVENEIVKEFQKDPAIQAYIKDVMAQAKKK